MSATLHAIKNAATTTFQVGDLFFQLRKVRTSDVAKIGVAAIGMMNPINQPNEDDEEPALESALRRLSPKQIGELTDMQAAVTCAGVMGISVDGENFEKIDLVMDSAREDCDAARLCVHSLPPGCVEKLFQEILELSTGGGAADRLRSFLEEGELDGPANGRSSRAKVRKNPRRNSRQ